MSYAVKEIFCTLQGEGAQTGRAAVFCRFAGCNLWSGREQDRATAACNFCDTDFVGVDGQRGGRFADARALLDHAAGANPAAAEVSPRAFTLPGLTALLEGAGLQPGAAHGVQVFADLVPSVLVDADPGAAEALRSLETAAATYPPLRDIAAKLHMLGRR